MHFLRSLAVATALLGAVGANVAPRYTQVGGPYQPAYITGSLDTQYGDVVVASPSGKELFVGALNPGLVSVLSVNGNTGSFVDKQRLSSPNPAQASLFGIAIALGGKHLAVGAPNEGAVYIYKKSAGKSGKWAVMQTLTGAAAGTGLGSDVAMSKDGKTLVAAAAWESTGAVYVYRLTGLGKSAQYTLVQGPLVAAGAVSGFGSAVAVSEDGKQLAVAGEDINQDWQVWLYTWNKAQGGFVPMATPELQVGGQIETLAFSPKGELAVCAGTPSYTGQLLIATTAGSGKAAKAYTVKQTLVPTGSGYTPSGFCSSLDFSPDGKSLAVGETGYLAGTEEGAVWVLQKTTGKSGWAFVAGPIMSTPANNGASLGFSVAITKTHLFSGAIGYVDAAGALFAFKKQ